MFVTDVAVGVILAAVVLAPILHVLVPLDDRGSRPALARSMLLALGGLAAAAVTNFLFGWIPLLGALVPPAAWSALLRVARGVDWPTAIAVGSVAWALSVVSYRIVGAVA